MPISCLHKVRHGRQFCVSDCPTTGPDGVFDYLRVEKPADVPAYDPLVVDVPVLDMNHGWPNLGHDSLVHAVLDAGCDLVEPLRGTGLRVRALSYDVRRSGMVPEGPERQFSLYLGTGGPGHIDPRQNDGVAEWSQGVKEDPSWEVPAFRLFDEVVAHEDAALVAVCHSFGVLSRWSGAAAPVLRSKAKGKSTGILENILTNEAREHPWFKRLAAELPDGRRLRVVENRLFDLVASKPFPPGIVPIGYETEGLGGPPGEGVTMLEFARDRGGMPRVFAVNHHPEIVDRFRQVMILEQKYDRGEVSHEWYQERLEILTRTYPDENSDQRLHVTSDYTLLGPLRFHLYKAVRRRAEERGLRVAVHEEQVLQDLERSAVAISGPATEGF